MIAYIIQRKTDKCYVYDIDLKNKTTFAWCEHDDNYRVPKLFSRHDIDKLLKENRLSKKYRVIMVILKKLSYEEALKMNKREEKENV